MDLDVPQMPGRDLHSMLTRHSVLRMQTMQRVHVSQLSEESPDQVLLLRHLQPSLLRTLQRQSLAMPVLLID